MTDKYQRSSYVTRWLVQIKIGSEKSICQRNSFTPSCFSGLAYLRKTNFLSDLTVFSLYHLLGFSLETQPLPEFFPLNMTS